MLRPCGSAFASKGSIVKAHTAAAVTEIIFIGFPIIRVSAGDYVPDPSIQNHSRVKRPETEVFA
jgi:hypothetical protein